MRTHYLSAFMLCPYGLTTIVHLVVKVRICMHSRILILIVAAPRGSKKRERFVWQI